MSDDERREMLGDRALEACDRLAKVWDKYMKDDRYCDPRGLAGFDDAIYEILEISQTR